MGSTSGGFRTKFSLKLTKWLASEQKILIKYRTYPTLWHGVTGLLVNNNFKSHSWNCLNCCWSVSNTFYPYWATTGAAEIRGYQNGQIVVLRAFEVSKTITILYFWVFENLGLARNSLELGKDKKQNLQWARREWRTRSRGLKGTHFEAH